MKTKTLLFAGGILNSILVLFHIFLGYQIFKTYSGADFYPLMQMLNVGGILMILFLAYTSLIYAGELLTLKAGRPVIALNIILYLTRGIGEIILFPHPKIIIIIVCLIIAGIYITAYFKGRKEIQKG